MKKKQLGFAAEVATIVAIYWLAYPGLLSSDSQTIFEESKSWVFNTGHPPIMGMIWGGLNFLHQGPELMLLAQLCVFGSGLKLVIDNLLPNTRSLIRALIFVLAMLSPMVLSIVGVLWKDIWCTAFLAIAGGLMLRVWRTRSRFGAHSAGVILALFVAILFRPNAVGASIAISAGVFHLGLVLCDKFPGHEYLRRILALVGGIVVSLVLFLAGNTFDRSVGVGVPAWTIYFFDIAGVVMNSENKHELASHIQQNYPLILRDARNFVPMLEDSFIPYTAVRLNVQWGNPRSPFVLPMTPENTAGYKDAWAYAIKADPWAYIKYRAEYAEYMLGMYYTPGAGRNGWVLADLSHCKNAYAYAYVDKYERTWLFSGMLWLGVCSIFALGLLLRERFVEVASHAWLGLSAVGLVSVLFFVGPAPDYRYTFWSTILGILFFACAMWRLCVWFLATVSRNDESILG